MLTVKIKDKDLEKRIIERSRSFGKSTQEFVNELLSNASPENKGDIFYQRLSPAAHGYIINQKIEIKNIFDESSNPFSEINDAADYVESLRKNAWRKK